MIKVNQFPDHTKLICVFLVLNIFAKIFISAKILIFVKIDSKIFAKIDSKYRENDDKIGRNFAKINYFRMSFENFVKEILRKFRNPSYSILLCRRSETKTCAMCIGL